MARTRQSARPDPHYVAAVNLREKKAKEKSDREPAGLAAGGSEAARRASEIRAKLPETTRPERAERDQEYPNLLSDITAKNCNPQTGSAFFTKLPSEVRTEIYALIFAQYEITSQAYPEDAFYYRPGCTAPMRIDTAFLYTCRRAVYEARYIPLQTATHELWASVDTPENVALMRDLRRGGPGTNGLKEQHLPYMRNFHIYGNHSDISSLNMCVGSWACPWMPFRCYPRHVTMTVPYTGWRTWMYGTPPELSEYFLDLFPKQEWPESLREIRLRFETMEVFAEELDELVASLRTIKLPLRDQELRGPKPPPLPPITKYLSADGIPPKVSTWTGPHSDRLKQSWCLTEHLGPDPMDVTEIWYYVVEASWKVTSDI